MASPRSTASVPPSRHERSVASIVDAGGEIAVATADAMAMWQAASTSPASGTVSTRRPPRAATACVGRRRRERRHRGRSLRTDRADRRGVPRTARQGRAHEHRRRHGRDFCGVGIRGAVGPRTISAFRCGGHPGPRLGAAAAGRTHQRPHATRVPISEQAVETAAFTIFLHPRMLGCAAEIDDHMNRGRNMDTRTPASQCRFVA